MSEFHFEVIIYNIIQRSITVKNN